MGNPAYFVGPGEPGPGVLVLPSWFGATSGVRRRADALADLGRTVLVPDLNFGERPATVAEAEEVLAAADPNQLARSVQASAGLLGERAAGDRIAVVGFGMGGSMALWLSVRRPDLVTACVSVYGHQSIDFDQARARYQLHVADQDPFVSDDDAAFMEATMRMEGLEVEVIRHAATVAGFADEGGPGFDPDRAQVVWDHVVAFMDVDDA